MSLQTGKVVGRLKRPIIDIAKLEVVAFFCALDQDRKAASVLLMRDIRQIARDAIIVDSFEDVSDPRDIVRLQPLLEKPFQPIGAQVVDQQGRKLGRVDTYTINLKTGLLQKLYVHQSLIRSMFFSNIMVDRTQIIEAQPGRFVVSDTTTPELLGAIKPAAKPTSSP